MNITITTIDEKELVISNEDFDNDNCISLNETELYLDDLLSALKGFVEYRKLNHERDERYKD